MDREIWTGLLLLLLRLRRRMKMRMRRKRRRRKSRFSLICWRVFGACGMNTKIWHLIALTPTSYLLGSPAGLILHVFSPSQWGTIPLIPRSVRLQSNSLTTRSGIPLLTSSFVQSSGRLTESPSKYLHEFEPVSRCFRCSTKSEFCFHIQATTGTRYLSSL